MRPKKPMPIPGVEQLGQDLKGIADKLRARFPAWTRLASQVSQKPYDAVAAVAVHPGILAELGTAAEVRDFAGCYKRYPDQVIEALAFARRLAKDLIERETRQREKNATTQQGRAIDFFQTTAFVGKHRGKLVAVDKLPSPATVAIGFECQCGCALKSVELCEDSNKEKVLRWLRTPKKIVCPNCQRKVNAPLRDEFERLFDEVYCHNQRARQVWQKAQIPVVQLTDGEVAQFLTDASGGKLPVQTDSVKSARQSLSSSKGKK